MNLTKRTAVFYVSGQCGGEVDDGSIVVFATGLQHAGFQVYGDEDFRSLMSAYGHDGIESMPEGVNPEVVVINSLEFERSQVMSFVIDVGVWVIDCLNLISVDVTSLLLLILGNDGRGKISETDGSLFDITQKLRDKLLQQVQTLSAASRMLRNLDIEAKNDFKELQESIDGLRGHAGFSNFLQQTALTAPVKFSVWLGNARLGIVAGEGGS